MLKYYIFPTVSVQTWQKNSILSRSFLVILSVFKWGEVPNARTERSQQIQFGVLTRLTIGSFDIGVQFLLTMTSTLVMYFAQENFD